MDKPPIIVVPHLREALRLIAPSGSFEPGYAFIRYDADMIQDGVNPHELKHHQLTILTVS